LPKLPVVSGREAIRALRRAGFTVDEIEGSHHILVHEILRKRVSIPVHGPHELKPGTLRGIIRDAGLTVDEFCKLLK
jgi:predicted RNA binding protein YcfA (HicA-like mRNA interferase family)